MKLDTQMDMEYYGKENLAPEDGKSSDVPVLFLILKFLYFELKIGQDIEENARCVWQPSKAYCSPTPTLLLFPSPNGPIFPSENWMGETF